MSELDPQVGEYMVHIFWFRDKPWLIGVMTGRVEAREGRLVEVVTLSMEEVSLN